MINGSESSSLDEVILSTYLPEAKANRTGTDRTKAIEALVQTSQLLDGVELPFRSSQ